MADKSFNLLVAPQTIIFELRTIAQSMDQTISKILKVIYRNRWAASGTFLSVFGGLIIYLWITPRLYSAEVRLILDEKPASSISPLGRDLAQTPGDNSKALATYEELVRSKRVLSKAIVRYKQSVDPSVAQTITLGGIKSELKTEVVPGTQIIELSFRHQDPEVTAALLNLIATGVVQENAETIRSEARATRRFLENQIPQRQQQLVSIEAAISQFKQNYNIVSLEETDSKRLTESIANAEENAQQISAELRQVQTRNLALSQVTDKRNTQETYQSIRGGQHPDLTSLREKLASLESQLALKRESLTEEHPDVQQLLTEKNATQLLYQEKLSSLSNTPSEFQDVNGVAADTVTQQLSEKLILSDIERNELGQKLLSTRAHISDLNKRRQQYPILEKTLASLTRQMETAAQSVNLLKQKLDEARIAEAQIVSNLRIIEEAEKPKLPTFPNIPSLLLLGTIAALIFSVGVVLVIEGVDSKLRDPDDINFTELPILGLIPQQTGKLLQPTLTVADLHSDPALLESFRVLVKNIQYKNDHESRILIVTSAISGEGKSYIASSLAIVSAMMSKKTLLIDADIRRPTIHDAFQIPLAPGLQDILKDNFEEIGTSVIQKTSVKNLSVMTAGYFSHDDIFSLESESTSNLLRNLEKNYESIIVDTPPLMACADALTFSHYFCQTLMVAKLNLTPKDGLKQAIGILQSNNINLVGLAINGSSTKNNEYYRYLKKDYALAS